jgi:hypothetical protein
MPAVAPSRNWTRGIMGDINIEDLMQNMRDRAGARVSADGRDSIPRLQSSLAVASRAHDQLPPVTTYRRGPLARIELWVKRQLKRATHWFTWEQVNFNAAVNRALNETVATLQTLERQLSLIKGELDANAATVGDCQLRLAKLESSFAAVENRIGSLASQPGLSNVDQQKIIELLLSEQRVCFKQLSLEINETARISDAARQSFEFRLAELAARIDEIAGKQPKAMAAGHDVADTRDPRATVL